jgi:hypothetical protein
MRADEGTEGESLKRWAWMMALKRIFEKLSAENIGVDAGMDVLLRLTGG